jgi:hypothetical protein
MRRLTRALVLAVVPVAAGALISTSCVFNGCADSAPISGLIIDVRVALEPATYRLEIDAEGDTLRVTYQLAAGAGDHLVCVEGCTLTGSRVEVVDAYGAFRRDGQGLSAIVKLRGGDAGPARATLRVYRDDVFLAGATVEPDYVTSEPNGPGCGDLVRGQVLLEVP